MVVPLELPVGQELVVDVRDPVLHGGEAVLDILAVEVLIVGHLVGREPVASKLAVLDVGRPNLSASPLEATKLESLATEWFR